MRTTLLLDDSLYRQAKHLAVDTRRTLTSIFEEALRNYLAQSQAEAPAFSIRDVAWGSGGLVVEPSLVKQVVDQEEAERHLAALAPCPPGAGAAL
jgi:predicted transcriptional regulator